MTSNQLKYIPLGINSQHEYIVYMQHDCPICLSEGFEALTRICISNGDDTIIASLNVIESNLLKCGEISLSTSAAKVFKVKEGDLLTVSHLQPIESLRYVRSKIYNKTLTEKQYKCIIGDIVKGNYSNVYLSAFITACAGDRMNLDEIISLTKVMIQSGKQMTWEGDTIVDKHCIGGLPGNRTTPIVVSIVAALGLTMPKTSSRAITSPAGTVDTMEVITNVNLNEKEIRSVIHKEGACMAWGGLAKLSPADDILIRVEKALDVDSVGQLIASVLSKKVAAGSKCVVIDIPVGETAKIRTEKAAKKLKDQMEKVAEAIGLKIKVLITDGSQPIGRGIGPSLEARDILAVLKNESDELNDLKERSLLIAGELIDLSGINKDKSGIAMARELLESGKAYDKFKKICMAQGAFRPAKIATYQFDVRSGEDGTVKEIDNRKIAKIAKLAGAPDDQMAGVDLKIKIGSKIESDQILYTIHSESKGELNYALEFLKGQENIIIIK